MNHHTTAHCIPCESGTPPLTEEQYQPLLAQIPDWKLIPGETPALTRTWKFKNFSEAMAFVNKVADLAEAEGHHPDISLHGWNKVTLTLSTHAISGLSHNDFILAGKIDEICKTTKAELQ